MASTTGGITGLASGFNSASYISAIMKQESAPLDKLQVKIDNNNAYKNFFNTLNTKLSTLKDAAQALGDLDAFKDMAATNSNASVLSAVTGAGAVNGNYTIKVNSLVSAQVSASKGFSATDKVGEGSNPLKITINGKDYSLGNAGDDMETALTNVAKLINADADLKITASVMQTEPGKKSLVLTSAEPGAAGSFSLDNSALWQKNSDGGIELQKASNANFTINGLPMSSATNEIKDAIPGLTLNLTDVGTSTVKVSQDTSKLVDKVDKFVNAYNDIVTTIRNNTKKSQKNSDGSLSLTLQGDPMLRDILTQLNNWMGAKVGDDKSAFQLFSQIGLEIDKGVTSSSLMTGTITFDKDLFAKKLTENPTAVENMFKGEVIQSKDKDGNDITVSFTEMFSNNLKDWTNSVDGMITSKIKGYDSEISYVTNQMTSMKERLDKREEMLNKQYANLEVVMSTLNNQKSWLTSQFNALTNSSSK